MNELITAVVDTGLGNSAYLVDLGDGRGLAVDASRDLRALDAAADARGLRVVAAADTHLHADFLSGATRLADRDGATVYASAAGGRLFGHVGLADEDEVHLGGLTLRAWSTPGHTGEHLTYLLLDGEQVLAAFTGGSLIVGAAARTDLVAAEQTEALARAQWLSLQRLLTLPDATRVLPTHGVGSFCSAAPAGPRTSTIGHERRTNPLLGAPDEDAFVRRLISGLGTFPPYFLRLGELNRLGPAPARTEPLPSLSTADVLRYRETGAEVVDVRPVEDYAAGHVPGALSIVLREQFATWLGWLVLDPSTPLVFVRSDDQDPDEIAWQARKVGYDELCGELVGLTDWADQGQPVARTPLRSPAEVDAGELLDVRQTSEVSTSRVAGARHIELGRLASDVPEGPVVTMCGHGERAATAASLLERAGRPDVSILAAGPSDWAAAHRTALA